MFSPKIMKSEDGLTLIEVVIATIIMVITLLPLMNTYYSGAVAYRTAGRETKVLNLAQAVMEEKISLSDDLLQKEEGTFEDYPGFEDYYYQVKVESFEGRQDLKLIEVTVKKVTSPPETEIVLTTVVNGRYPK